MKLETPDRAWLDFWFEAHFPSSLELIRAGDLVAFLGSAQMGFMTGQNIVDDGGYYQGLFQAVLIARNA